MWLGRRIQPDTGGAGRYRAGNAIESLYFIEHSNNVVMGSVVSSDRVFSSPGIMGGYPGSANYRYYVIDTNLKEVIDKGMSYPTSEGDNPSNPDWERLLEGKTVRTDGQSGVRPLKKYDLWQQLNGAGGGYGDPIERDPELVKKDLENDVVTLRTVKNVYCVQIDPNTLEIDREATKRLREEMREARKKRGVPVKEYRDRLKEKVLSGNIPKVPKSCLNDCFGQSERFLKEFRECWNLPDDFKHID
jgi:acetone carboxylase alpha subunit